MSRREGKNITTQIVELLHTKGPMSVRDLGEHISFRRKSIHNKALILEKEGKVTIDDNKILHLVEGVTPESLGVGEVDMVTTPEEITDMEEEGNEVTQPEKKPTQGSGRQTVQALLESEGIKGEGQPLSQRQQFIQHMVRIGVAPRDAIPTIADIFFSGDTDDLNWLYQVLAKDAQGFVSKTQRRLIMSWWSRTRELDFDPDEYGLQEPGEIKTKKTLGKKGEDEEATRGPFDPGQGWMIAKDKDGDWIPIPGGPLTYPEAMNSAAQRQALKSYSDRFGTSDDDDTEEEGATKARSRAPKREETVVEKMLLMMMEKMFDSNAGKSSGESETIRQLREKVEAMEQDRVEQRFERLEATIAANLSRDPWDDYDGFVKQANRLGWAPNVVTDSSPAVQLIKDSTDKLDKTGSRLLGLMERIALRGDVFEPEHTRTPEEKDTKAGQLLTQVSGNERSKALRRETFGI